MRIFFVCVLATAFGLTASAEPTTPKPGSALRKEVLDAIRPSVEKDLGQEIVFKVEALRVDENWAFLNAQPLTKKDQKPIDYSKTRYAKAVAEVFFDDWLCALAKKKGGKWVVVALEIGATDVAYVPWPNHFGVPREVVFGN